MTLLQQCEEYLKSLGFVKEDNPKVNCYSLTPPSWGCYYVSLLENAWDSSQLVFNANCQLLPIEDDTWSMDYCGVIIENVEQLIFCITHSIKIQKFKRTSISLGSEDLAECPLIGPQ